MIRHIRGDIFKTNTESIVNPVNTQGVMGKGLALGCGLGGLKWNDVSKCIERDLGPLKNVDIQSYSL